MSHHLSVVFAFAALSACRGEEPTPSDSSSTDTTTETAPRLEWDKTCSFGECATVEVPFDHDDPDSDTFPLPIARVRRASPKDYKGVILSNFGGPGADGRPMVGFLASVLGPSITEDYDVVSFDPRGGGTEDVGQPLGCADDTSLLDAVYDAYDGSTDPASLTALIAAQRAFLDSCRDSDPELYDHLGFNAWADDLESIREALGVEKLSYFGASAGTGLGMVYADRYPDRVDRFVLDSNLHPDGGLATLSKAQVAGLATGVQAWVDWCAADPECLVHTDPLGALASVLTTAQEAPLLASGRPVTYGRATLGVAVHLYSEYSWPGLGEVLAAALDGDGAPLLAASDAYQGRTFAGYAPGTPLYFLTECTDSDEQLTVEQIAARVAADEAAVGAMGGMTRLNALDLTWCTAFGPGLDPAKDTTAAGAAPFLMLQNLDDTATPIEAAEAAHDLLENDPVLVTQGGASHGALFSAGTSCLSDLVTAFYLEGALPADGTHCP
jgi:pimeloyl-ACP methyl ester carboxylesterase